MAHFILGPVQAAPEDLAWIEDLRRAHDPHHRFVAAHVTLVFGFEQPPLATAVEHVRAIAGRFAPFDYRLTTARAVRDVGGHGSHVFLIPSLGAADIVALHDALYEGPLAGELRTDIPFISHVTVGQLGDHGAARALAERLSGAVDILARLNRLSLVGFDGGPVEAIGTWALEG